ncbi:MAG: bifunctional riboflavin kinase/FAD synthetase [Verrucomicrobia bacterium]|nr:bifunctional riboflavin kinase/FAD synthetase [Verrucomicrobiota bacterium]MDA1086216.1 bifunctional riboflavin kinase/FAD synthetase [Verrucomicrobiota bacterium]
MKTLRNIAALKEVTRPVSLAIGFFDGVHLGHASVIRQARDVATDGGGETWVLTFDPHPRVVLQPETAPPLLSPSGRKLHLLDDQGVDGCVLMTFNRDLASQSPADFLDLLRGSIPTLTHVAVGQNFHFGHERTGSPALLSELLGAHGIEVRVAEPVSWDGTPISSTRIRHAIHGGDLAAAAAMLGRHYTVSGVVEHGRQVGREIGFPTANVKHEQQVLPPHGVYAATASTAGSDHPAVLNLGCRPSIEASQETLLEVHLLDFGGDLYGQELHVTFREYLRPERGFPDGKALAAQISKDVECARRVLLAQSRNSP